VNRQTLIDTLGQARIHITEGESTLALFAVNLVRDALLEGEPTDSE
jgi:hypothetical protein